MKRGVFDVLRRALDNTLVNWPLVAIRVAELFAFFLLSIAAAVAILAPILVSIGVELAELTDVADVERAMFSLLEKWILLVWIVLAVLVLLFVFMIAHSFVEAGCARVYVDAERIAGPAVAGPRSRFKVFSMQRWWAGAKSGWWTVFWIYNFAWSVAGLILLVPLLPTAVLMFVFRETPQLIATTGCLGMLATLMLMIVVGIVTGMWVNRGLAEWGAHQTGPAASLSTAWRALKSDLGRHLLIALAIFVVAIAGASFFSSFSFIAAWGQGMGRGGMFAMMPLRLLTSMLSWIFSAAVSGWYLASYSALAVEDTRSV